MKFIILIALSYSSIIKNIYSLDKSLGRRRYGSSIASKYSKRGSSFSFKTTSFNVDLECNFPGDTNATCIKVMNTLEHGLKLLEQYVYLPEPVNVLSQYYSFCPSSNSCDVDNVLGMAMPSTMIQLEGSEFGLDPKFLYPPSLIKQYYPNDENITQIEYDIVSEFNSDYNWYFLGDEQDWGASHAVNGGFSNQTNQKSFEFLSGIFNLTSYDARNHSRSRISLILGIMGRARLHWIHALISNIFQRNNRWHAVSVHIQQTTWG